MFMVDIGQNHIPSLFDRSLKSNHCVNRSIVTWEVFVVFGVYCHLLHDICVLFGEILASHQDIEVEETTGKCI